MFSGIILENKISFRFWTVFSPVVTLREWLTRLSRSGSHASHFIAEMPPPSPEEGTVGSCTNILFKSDWKTASIFWIAHPLMDSHVFSLPFFRSKTLETPKIFPFFTVPLRPGRGNDWSNATKQEILAIAPLMLDVKVKMIIHRWTYNWSRDNHHPNSPSCDAQALTEGRWPPSLSPGLSAKRKRTRTQADNKSSHERDAKASHIPSSSSLSFAQGTKVA